MVHEDIFPLCTYNLVYYTSHPLSFLSSISISTFKMNSIDLTPTDLFVHQDGRQLDVSSDEDETEKYLEQHRCYDILLSRKHVIKNIKFRVGLVSDILNLSSKAYLVPELQDDQSIHKWYQVYSTLDKRKHQWTSTLVARALCEFDMILRKNAKILPMDAEQFPAAVQYYAMFMEELETAVELEKNETRRIADKKVGKQKGYTRAQDSIDLSLLSIESLDNSLCASVHCRHRCLLPTGMSPVEMDDFNNNLKSQHRTALQKWNAASSSRRTKSRPKSLEGKMTSQELTCLCSRMNCLNSIDDTGCFICEQACKNAKLAGRDDRPYFDKNFNCTCPVCTCQCDVIYHRHDTSNLERQTQKEGEFSAENNN